MYQIHNQPVRHGQSPLIFVVLVAFNNSEDVISCLKSLKEQTFSRFEVIIVDNASNQVEIDNITMFITSQEVGNSRIKFIKNDSNLGYSGGNNVGIKYAIEHGARYVLGLNPDTLLARDAISTMIEVAERDSKIGAIGPVIDEGSRIIYGGKIEWLKPELRHLTTRHPLSAKNFFLTGACLLVRREVFEKIATERERGSTKAQQSVRGLFDERYFLYFEDADLCVRIQKAGYKLSIADQAKLYHKVSATTSKLGAPKLLRYHYRNAHVFNMKHAPAWAFILLPFWSILIIIKQLLKLMVGKDKQISKEILLGVLDFYRGNFGRIT